MLIVLVLATLAKTVGAEPVSGAMPRITGVLTADEVTRNT